MELLGKYRNGNTDVSIMRDGTRICETNDDEFDFSFPMSMDVTITTKCDGGCPFCYMNCNENGVYANLDQPWLKTVKPYTEMAINGNDLSHPDLIPFLTRLKYRNVIVSITVNQKHFMKNLEFLHYLTREELIKGLGVSLVSPTDDFIKEVKKFPNAVLHVINGVLSENDVKALSNNNLKILILGYKHLRRGVDYYDSNEEDITNKQNWLNNNLKNILHKFKVVSFDNLALKQLNVKELLTNEEWEEFYAGDDGTCSMFIDMVTKTFARSSTRQLETQKPILDSVEEMFEIVKKENTHDL